MWHKRQDGQKEQNHRKKAEKKIPGNTGSLSSQWIFENRIGVDRKHFPERNPENRNMNIIEKVFDFEEKTL